MKLTLERKKILTHLLNGRTITTDRAGTREWDKRRDSSPSLKPDVVNPLYRANYIAPDGQLTEAGKSVAQRLASAALSN